MRSTLLSLAAEGIAARVKDTVREMKLKASDSASLVLSQIVSAVIAVILVVAVLVFLAVALAQWMESLLGAPWGMLIAAGALLVVALVVLLSRKKLFRGVFKRTFDGLVDHE